MLFSQKWRFWPRFLLQRVILHQHTKFDEDTPMHGVKMALWWNPKWRSPPSWILVKWQFWLWSNSWYYFVPTYKTWAKSLIPGRRSYGNFSKIQMATTTILFLQKLLFWPRFLLQSVLLHQLTKFDENLPIHDVEMALWWNQKWRPPPSWILVRWHFWSRDPICGANLYLHTKFGERFCNGYYSLVSFLFAVLLTVPDHL